MLCARKKLAKTSSTPGKTQLINHFIINDNWYLVDLPGYGYAKTSRSESYKWQKFIMEYLTKRENLLNVFVLIDSRLKPQKIDLEFMEWLGEKEIPFSIIFTKLDKLTNTEKRNFATAYSKEMLKTWEIMPPYFVSSAEDTTGREEILDYISEINSEFNQA